MDGGEERTEGVEDWARRRRVVIWMEGEGELFLRERRRAAEDSTNRSVPPSSARGGGGAPRGDGASPLQVGIRGWCVCVCAAFDAQALCKIARVVGWRRRSRPPNGANNPLVLP